MKKCFICGDKFEPKRVDQKICRSEPCTKEQNRIWKQKSYKAKPKRRRRCTECGKLFKPYHSKQKTCGSDLCIRSRKNFKRKAEEKEFECVICGDKTWSSQPAAVLCGKKECRKKYVNEFNKKGNYKNKQKARTLKSASVFGHYGEEEIEQILKLRAKGLSYTKIALKLKRTLNSITKKCCDLLKVPKYKRLYEGYVGEERDNQQKKDVSYWNNKVKECFEK